MVEGSSIYISSLHGVSAFELGIMIYVGAVSSKVQALCVLFTGAPHATVKGHERDARGDS
jgi:hypothetical protein